MINRKLLWWVVLVLVALEGIVYVINVTAKYARENCTVSAMETNDGKRVPIIACTWRF